MKYYQILYRSSNGTDIVNEYSIEAVRNWIKTHGWLYDFNYDNLTVDEIIESTNDINIDKLMENS